MKFEICFANSFLYILSMQGNTAMGLWFLSFWLSSFLNTGTHSHMKNFIPVTEMKERPEGQKIPTGSPRSLTTLGMSVSAKFKSANKHGATKSGVIRIPSVVSYRCYVATAE